MPDNLSDKQLKLGYWWVLHRAVLHRVAVVVIAAIALSFCGYALWQFTDWLTSRQAEEEALRQLVRIPPSEFRKSPPKGGGGLSFTADSKITRNCANVGCDLEATNRCAKCKSVYYCGRKCQVEHYANHRYECK